jgi:hypothetical protein
VRDGRAGVEVWKLQLLRAADAPNCREGGVAAPRIIQNVKTQASTSHIAGAFIDAFCPSELSCRHNVQLSLDLESPFYRLTRRFHPGLSLEP